MNKARPHLLYNFIRKIFFIFISFLSQSIKYKLNPTYINREIKPNNRGLHVLCRDVLSLVVVVQAA
jgi:hypothetical protein